MRAWVGLAAVAGLVLAAGCGGGGDDPAGPTTSIPTWTAPTSVPDATIATATTATTAATAATTTVVPTATTSAPPTTTTLPPPRTATLLFTGDLIPHAPVVRAAERMADEAGGARAHDFRPLFADVADRIAGADLAVCHLESPLTDDLSALSGYPRFNGPAGLADDLVDLGYDACSTASNHSLDNGWLGVLATLAALDAAGLAQSGMAASEEAAVEPLLLDAAGITVGLVSATFGTNGLPRPEATPWIVTDLDVDELLEHARRARAAGAEFVVLALHWGVEYLTTPTATQRDQAESLLADPDVDLIVGHHAHVVQPVGRVGEEFVAYGLGNFLSNQSASCCAVGAQDGVIVEVVLEELQGGAGDGTPEGESRVVARQVVATPTRVDRADDHRVVDVAAAVEAAVDAGEDPDADLVASWFRTAERILAEELPAEVLEVRMGRD